MHLCLPSPIGNLQRHGFNCLYSHVIMNQKNEVGSVVLLYKLNKLHIHTWTSTGLVWVLVVWFFFSPQLKKKGGKKNEKLDYDCFHKYIISLVLLWALTHSTNQDNSELSKCFSFYCVTYIKWQSPNDIYQKY